MVVRIHALLCQKLARVSFSFWMTAIESSASISQNAILPFADTAIGNMVEVDRNTNRRSGYDLSQFNSYPD